MKKREPISKYVLIPCIIALLIPSIIAVIVYATAGKAPVNVAAVSKISVTDLGGETYDFEGDTAGVGAIFKSMNANASELSSLPDQLSSMNFFKVSYISGSKEVVYKYYFSLTGDSYYVNNNGVAYRITATDAAAFLATQYAHSLYVSADPPVLKTGSLAEVLPVSMSWNYKASDGTTVALASPTVTTDTGASYKIDGSLSLLFSVQPDLFTVEIKDASGNVLFNDNYSNLTNLSLSSTATLTINAQAKWYEDASRDYSGEAAYSFKVLVTAPAVFYLGETSLTPGEFTIVTAYNIEDISKITFKSEPALTYGSSDITPVFYKDTDKNANTCFHAFIPTYYGTEAGVYKLTFGYGAVSQSVNLNIEAKTFRTYTKTVSQTVAETNRSDAAVAAFRSAVLEVSAKTPASRLWNDGAFGEGLASATVTLGYGRRVTVSSTKQVYDNECVEYSAAAGVNVLAVSKGTVVYTGTLDYPGNFVVVDHGLGLRSWYLHLSEVSVKVGDSVDAGAVLGKTGSTGFASGALFAIMYTVYDVPVCPYQLWSDGDNGIIMFSK